jgi:arginine decarboxylase
MDNGWTIEESAALYKLPDWGLGYFGINGKGNVVFHPNGCTETAIDVKAVLDDVLSRGIKLPVLLRFQDILRDRVVSLNKAFESAIEEFKYSGRYFGVYPIKVNQLREVVEEILDAGEPHLVGLEAGSKGELIAVLAMNSQGCLTILNGYKDECMMRLACMGVKLGKQVIVVVEKLTELDVLLRAAHELGVRPLIGIRCRLQTEGSGRWRSSGGHAAKFGLTTPDIIAAVRELRRRNMLDCLRLVHFHIGSQVTDIKHVKDAVKEGARVYAKLRKMGVGVEYVDCGGGLGVDYEGTNTLSDYSMNYSPEEYVRSVVYSVQEVCQQEKVQEPHIVTETGRALVAHHCVLVTNIFGVIEAGSSPISVEETGGESRVVREMRDIIRALTVDNLAESYHDGHERLEEAFSMFKLGFLELEDKAKVETLFWQLCAEIKRLLPQAEVVSEDLSEMLQELNDQYLANFSVFLSLPDAWAIQHLFPVMPVHRLDERPVRNAGIVDITCDSDGRIDEYVCSEGGGLRLPLHAFDGKPYFLGIFLVGAYQATMGDIHNLLGRVTEVHVFRDDEEPGGYYLEEIITGQRVRDVLCSVQYSEYDLVRMVKDAIEARVKAGKLKPREGVDLLNFYEAALEEYTYIDPHGRGPALGTGPLGAEAEATTDRISS